MNNKNCSTYQQKILISSNNSKTANVPLIGVVTKPILKTAKIVVFFTLWSIFNERLAKAR
jgi:hypothetical protein